MILVVTECEMKPNQRKIKTNKPSEVELIPFRAYFSSVSASLYVICYFENPVNTISCMFYDSPVFKRPHNRLQTAGIATTLDRIKVTVLVVLFTSMRHIAFHAEQKCFGGLHHRPI